MNTKIKFILMGAIVGLFASFLVLSQWSSSGSGFRAAFDAEFLARPDGYPGLQKLYGIEFPSPPIQMDPGLMYSALANGTVNVIDAFATDGRIAAYNLRVLKDDKAFFPPYYAAPLVRKDILARYPEITDLLNSLSGKISDEKMQEMNYRVDEQRQQPEAVAREFLISSDLIREEVPGSGQKKGKVRVGGKHFTEQEILGEMISILIESNTDIEVERRLNLGGTIICFNALRAGDIDIYAEYTGTGLVNILQEEVINDPDKSYERVKNVFVREYDLVWLEPFGFNNTYTIAMKDEEAEALGIISISDLSEYLRRQRE